MKPDLTTLNHTERAALIQFLSQFVSDGRLAKFNGVVQNRTKHLTIVLEDLYQEHNISAVLRSCDCFGIQDVHIIENKNNFKINQDIALGSSKWLSLHKYKSGTTAALQNLKAKGYKIIATTPHENDCILDDLNVDQKTALVFGTELHGISNEVRQLADGFVRIPMFGFTESFNISVSVALCLHLLIKKTHALPNWTINAEEQENIKLNWLATSIDSSDLLIKEFLQKKTT